VNVASLSVEPITADVDKFDPRFAPESLGCTIVSVTRLSPTTLRDTLTVVEDMVPTKVVEGSKFVMSR
jgi:hypothetical protein